LESIIKNFICRELSSGRELIPIENDTSLIETGVLDSLALLSLLVFLENEFNISVDDYEVVLENFNTVDAICAYVRFRQELQLKH
jgi:acyl carrier protein